MPASSEVEASVREDNHVQNCYVEGEEIMLTIGEIRGFTQALLGAVQMMNALVKKLNLDKEKSEGIKEIGNVIRAIALSMGQYIGKMYIRRRTKMEQVKLQGVRRNTGKQGVIRAVNENRENKHERAVDDYSKRKMESPGEGRKVITAKRPRKGEPTYSDNQERTSGHLAGRVQWTRCAE